MQVTCTEQIIFRNMHTQMHVITNSIKRVMDLEEKGILEGLEREKAREEFN